MPAGRGGHLLALDHPATDRHHHDPQQAPGNPGFALMLVLLGLAGLALVIGLVTPVPERVRRRDRRAATRSARSPMGQRTRPVGPIRLGPRDPDGACRPTARPVRHPSVMSGPACLVWDGGVPGPRCRGGTGIARFALWSAVDCRHDACGSGADLRSTIRDPRRLGCDRRPGPSQYRRVPCHRLGGDARPPPSEFIGAARRSNHQGNRRLGGALPGLGDRRVPVVSRGTWLYMSARARRSLTLLWASLFIFSIGLQYASFASPDSARPPGRVRTTPGARSRRTAGRIQSNAVGSGVGTFATATGDNVDQGFAALRVDGVSNGSDRRRHHRQGRTAVVQSDRSGCQL